MRSARISRSRSALMLAGCGGSRPAAAPAAARGRGRAAAASAAPAAGLLHRAGRTAVPPAAGRRSRKTTWSTIAAHHRHGRLGQRPHDPGDHPGQRTDHAHRSWTPARSVKAGDAAALRRAAPTSATPSRRTARRRTASTWRSTTSIATRTCSSTRRSRSATSSRRRPTTTTRRPTCRRRCRRCGSSASRRRTSPRPSSRTSAIRPELAMRAPIAGTVVQKMVLPGQFIQAGTTAAFVISDVSTRLGAGAHLREGPAARAQSATRSRCANASFPTSFHGTVVVHRRHDRSGDAHHAGADRHAEHRRPAQEGSVPRRRRSTDKTHARGRWSCRPTSVLYDEQNFPFVYVQVEPGKFAQRQVKIGGAAAATRPRSSTASRKATASSRRAASSCSSPTAYQG